jgi:quaternary ammonium compound-resistance protein SugE
MWTGIGATGTLIIGIVFFNDPANLFRLFFASLIIVGIIGLKFTA